MLELTPHQLSLLERLAREGFQLVSFPLYPNAVGVRKGNCAALLGPVEGGGMKFAAVPCFLVEGSLSVLPPSYVPCLAWRPVKYINLVQPFRTAALRAEFGEC